MRRAHREISIAPPYDQALNGVLAFADYESAEHCLLALEGLRQRYRSEGDDTGVSYCRAVAKLGRRRAELISRNRRVHPEKRRQKGEIAFWFQVWLETPEIFRDWLQIRKSSHEFRQLQVAAPPNKRLGRSTKSKNDS